MVFWGQIRVDKTKLDQIITLPNFNFGQLFKVADFGDIALCSKERRVV